LEYEIVKNPMGLIQFTMNKGEKIIAEAAAMVYIRGNIETETRMRKGGFLKSLKAAAFGGESTGNMLGDIEVIPVDQEFIVNSGSFVGSTSELTLDTKWQGFTKGIFGTNMFMLKTVGTGDMFVNAWGGILKTELKTGEKMILDNYQLIALSSTAGYRVTKHGSYKTTLFGGEALVMEIIGPGTVYFQTKNLMEFVRALIPYLPQRRR
jgi:uncharacterized protein (AIM24 family)